MVKKHANNHYPARRITAIGWLALLWHVGVPLLMLAVLLDTVFYYLFTQVLGMCYGVSCL